MGKDVSDSPEGNPPPTRNWMKKIPLKMDAQMIQRIRGWGRAFGWLEAVDDMNGFDSVCS
jgi:hypothetical protein